ncbi:unnamed protein product [Rotaria sordida]|uniref:Uncharacterized protein n=1 Tax=Rotaria sordida TaxID=392033 RepID=A0A819TIJ7_9BILA|nr:unnamed protein product [Rotaria sordida]
MFSTQEDEIIDVSNTLEEDRLPESSPQSVKDTDSVSLKNNSKLTTTSSSSSINANKRYISKFKKEWLSNPRYSSFLKECKTDQTKALCIICNIQFSIQNSGIGDVNSHMKTKKHQDNVKSAEANKSKPIDASFSTTTSELDRLSAAEDSSIAKNITCHKTKAREIACNVLAPAFTNTIIQDLQNVSYFSISYDASSKGNAKMLPVVVQYFSKIGVNHGIIEFIKQQHETADKLFANIKYVLETNELKLEQLSSIGSDNTNVNIGQHHSVFVLFNQLIPGLIQEVQEANLLLQRHYTTGVNLYSIITDLLRKLNNRLRDDYFGCKVMDLCEKIQHPTEIDDLKKSFRSFIQTVIQYIESYYQDRSLLYKSISIFGETHIERIEWNSIEHCITFIYANNIDKDSLYNEFNRIRSKYVGIKDKGRGRITSQIGPLPNFN